MRRVAQVCECSGCFYQGLFVLICLHRLVGFCALCVFPGGPSLMEGMSSPLLPWVGGGGEDCPVVSGVRSWAPVLGGGTCSGRFRFFISNHKPFCTWCLMCCGPSRSVVSNLSFLWACVSSAVSQGAQCHLSRVRSASILSHGL